MKLLLEAIGLCIGVLLILPLMVVSAIVFVIALPVYAVASLWSEDA